MGEKGGNLTDSRPLISNKGRKGGRLRSLRKKKRSLVGTGLVLINR